MAKKSKGKAVRGRQPVKQLEQVLGEETPKGKVDSWNVLKNGVGASRDNVMILEGPAESLEAIRALLSSKEHWRNEMSGVAMVKW